MVQAMIVVKMVVKLSTRIYKHRGSFDRMSESRLNDVNIILSLCSICENGYEIILDRD